MKLFNIQFKLKKNTCGICYYFQKKLYFFFTLNIIRFGPLTFDLVLLFDLILWYLLWSFVIRRYGSSLRLTETWFDRYWIIITNCYNYVFMFKFKWHNIMARLSILHYVTSMTQRWRKTYSLLICTRTNNLLKNLNINKYDIFKKELKTRYI